MTTVPSTNSAALLILQQTSPIRTIQQQAAGSDDLLAVANGMSKQVSSDQQPTRAQAKVSESLFSVNHVSINKLKMDLIDRTGKALGVDQADYASRKDFVDAMQKALGKLKMEGGDDAVRGLEKELGLDKLGVSIQDVIDSAGSRGERQVDQGPGETGQAQSRTRRGRVTTLSDRVGRGWNIRSDDFLTRLPGSPHEDLP